VDATSTDSSGYAIIDDVEYRVLGPITVLTDGRPVKIGGPRQRMVLAVLLSNANHTVSQDALIDTVWAGEPVATSTLHSYVYELRQELGAEQITRQGDGYRMEVDADSFDALGFERLLEEGRRQLVDDPANAAASLRQALAMWYGAPYGEAGDNPMLSAEVARLQELRLVAVESRIDAELATGNHTGVIGDLETLVRQYPLRERFRAQQMLALYRSGRQVEALRAMEATRTYLAEELGLDPSAELRDLEQRILDQDPALHLGARAEAPSPPEVDAETGPRHVPTGQMVRGYELRQRIGEGGLGVVHRAFQPSVGREVAVKVIRPDFANHPAFIQRFETEAQVISQLEHPHIVPLFDYWRDPTGAYLVMPYLTGGSVAAALGQDGWNLGPALRLMDQIGGALAYAHRRGVTHRDVKPANVLLDAEGNAYLADFGIATSIADDSALWVTGPSAFVAPEVLRGEPHTARSDIFGLGVLAFNLLTGVVPPAGLPLPSLVDARRGLPEELDGVVARATADRPTDRFDKVDDLLRAIRQAVGADVVAVSEGDGAAEPVRNPYKGLRPFLETDAADFHGRDALVDALLLAVSAHNVVAVVGPSGSGKSSLVRAGLIPALRAGGLPGSGTWLTTSMFPGSYPFEELEAALLRVAVDRPTDLLTDLVQPHGLIRVTKRILPGDDATLMLIIDQFEELFSMVASEATRRSFLDNLVAVASDERSRVRVVLTMRADFFDRPLEYPEFAEALGRGMVTISPPTTDGLAQAIAAPARAVGIELEPGLVGRIIGDVENQPGGLPLLQYALTELFTRRHDSVLTIAGYEETGGVLGALGRRAEELYDDMPDGGREAVRQLFLRLVTVGEDAPDTRRRARQAELRSLGVDQAMLGEAISRYGAFRLLSFDHDPVTRGPTVEVAHEALLREWARLAGWIDDRREALEQRRRIDTAMAEWNDSGDPSFLLGGGRLEQAERWRATTDVGVTTDEDVFLRTSRELADATEEAARRRRWWLIAVLSILLLVVSGLAIAALLQRRAARQEARDATVRELAGESILALDEDPERAILLALEAVDLSRSVGQPALPEALGALQRAVQASRVEMRLEGGDSFVQADPGGEWFVTDDIYQGPDAILWDAEGNRLATLAGPGGVLTGIDVSPDGAMIAVSYDGTGIPDHPPVVLFEPATGAELGRLDGSSNWYFTPAFSPDGSQLAAGSSSGDGPGGVVTVWDVPSRRQIVSFTPTEFSADANTGLTGTVDFLPDGSVVTGDPAAHRLVFHSATTGTETGAVDLDEPVGNFFLDPSGTRFATGYFSSKRLQVRDLATGEKTVDIEVAEAQAIEWSPDGTVIAYTGNQGVITLIDATTGASLMELLGSGSVFDMAFLGGGTQLVNPSVDGATRIWDVTPDGPPALDALVTTRPQHGFQISTDGSQLAAYTLPPGGFELVDVASGGTSSALEDELVGIGSNAGLRTVSDDFSLMGSLQNDGRSTIRSLPDLDVVAELADCTTPLAFTVDHSRALVNTYACTADSDVATGTSRVIDVDTGREIVEIPEEWLYYAAFNPPGALEGGRYLAVTDQFAVTIYDTETGAVIGTLPPEDLGLDNHLHLAFDPEGRYLAAGTVDGVVWVVDLIAVVEGTSMVDALLFNQVAHTGPAPWPSITSEGVLATGGFDGLVRLWDIRTDRLLVEFRTELDDQMPTVFFAPDGSYLLYAETGNVIRKFDMDTDRLVFLAEDRATRELTVDECRRHLDPETCPAAET
jgi:serine/threonine protein kinase/DNA-binding SARP family transcriptional activator/WD40 repeat protein